MARRPRRILADKIYCCTQRTVDRQFLFKPQRTTKEIIGASAGRAQRKYPVKIYWLDFNINHKHAGFAPLSSEQKDLDNFVKFERLFNSLTAVGINRFLGREGPVFSSRDRIIEATDDEAAERQLLYSVTNPAKDGLTERVKNWEGLTSYNQLATGRTDRYSYVNRTAWHKAGGARRNKSFAAFTERVEVKLSPLPSLEAMPAKARQELFRRNVRELEKSFRDEREQQGRHAMTRRALEKIAHRDRPKTRAAKTPQPMCHSSTFEGAHEFKEGWRTFVDARLKASGMFLGGNWDVEFPMGSLRPPIFSVC